MKSYENLLVELLIKHESKVLWEYCDCGCPTKLAPRSKESLELIRALKVIKDNKRSSYND